MMAVSDSFYEETRKYTRHDCISRRFYLGEVNLHVIIAKETVLTVAYCGNLGRLYDFKTLLDVMSDMQPGSIQIFLVGDGDRRDWLLGELDRRQLPYQYFGSIYDPAQLANILCRCHLGFNGFVNTTASFSTKASTYLSAGLPILNSMRGDLEDLVLQHNIGLNYEGGNKASLASCLTVANLAKLQEMSENCKLFFTSELDREKVRKDLSDFLKVQFEPACGTSTGQDRAE